MMVACVVLGCMSTMAFFVRVVYHCRQVRYEPKLCVMWVQQLDV